MVLQSNSTHPGKVATPDILPSALSLFKPSIAAFKRNFLTFVVVGSLPFLLIAASIGVQIITANTPEFLRIAGAIITTILFVSGIILSFLTAPTLALTQLRSAEGVAISPRQAYRSASPFFLRWMGLTILLAIIYIAAIACFVVPFFFMLRRYVLAPFYLLGRNSSIGDAMRASASESRYHSRAVWELVFIQALLSLCSAVPIIGWVVGWIPSVMYACAPAIRYLQISDSIAGQKHALQAQTGS